METQWVTWALQALIVTVLLWFKQQLDRNTDSVIELREELPKNYVPKAESEIYRKETREAIHDLRMQVHHVAVKVAAVK